MSRAKTKTELLEAAVEEYNKLLLMIENMTEKELSVEFDFSGFPSKKEAHWSRDKCIRDIIIHLYEWHMLLIKWVEANRVGKNVAFLPEPYNFRTIADMNIGFFNKHQQTKLEDAYILFNDSHSKVLKIIEMYSDEELFTKKYFNWTGSSSLGSYCVSATSSHYNWAMKKLKAHKRICKNL